MVLSQLENNCLILSKSRVCSDSQAAWLVITGVFRQPSGLAWQQALCLFL